MKKSRSDCIDMRGQAIGRLQVIDRDSTSRKWVCRCQCGNQVLASGGNLRKGSVRSCGCLAMEVRVANKLTHGLSATAEYRIFMTMRARCSNKKSWKYAQYGGRGIEMRFDSFEAFIADIGPRPSLRHSVDRIENSGHYEPGNVRWATATEQRNNRRDSALYEVNGVTDSLTGFARRLGISPSSIRQRIAVGWSIERAATEAPNLKCQENGFRLRDAIADREAAKDALA